MAGIFRHWIFLIKLQEKEFKKYQLLIAEANKRGLMGDLKHTIVHSRARRHLKGEEGLQVLKNSLVRMIQAEENAFRWD